MPLLICALAAAGCSRSSSDTQAAAGGATDGANKAIQVQEQKLPAGAINIDNADISQVLPIYREMSGATLDVEQRINRAHRVIRYTNKESLTRAQALSQLEEVLHTQAGIVAKHVGTNHIVLTLELPAVSR